MFACDQNCPNWKSLSVCAHSVAVAELCGKLLEFVACFMKTKKAPSLTRFAEVTMPKGRGAEGISVSQETQDIGAHCYCTRKPQHGSMSPRLCIQPTSVDASV